MGFLPQLPRLAGSGARNDVCGRFGDKSLLTSHFKAFVSCANRFADYSISNFCILRSRFLLLTLR